jgi:hypothetical protein
VVTTLATVPDVAMTAAIHQQLADKACDEDACRILSAPGQAASVLMIRLSGRWEEPGDDSGQKLSLPDPPQAAFAQLRRHTIVQNKPPIVTSSGSDMSAATAAYAPRSP